MSRALLVIVLNAIQLRISVRCAEVQESLLCVLVPQKVAWPMIVIAAKYRSLVVCVEVTSQ